MRSAWRAVRPAATVVPAALARVTVTGTARILGLDPGSLRTGFGIIDCESGNLRIVAQGCIATSGGPLADRLRMIHARVAELIVQHAPQEIAVAPRAGEPSEPRDASETRAKGTVGKPAERSPGSPGSPASPATPARPGRLLVRSTPSGASVSVDGVAKGETPLALRDLDVGTRSVTIARRGYIPETRRILITKARPARTLEVRLASASAAEPVSPKPSGGSGPRPSTPASLGKPAVTTGTLAVESRPAGAAVTINGKPSGSTPLTINDLAPGDYQIVMTMPGYRNFTTTVRVVAGERARAAASLTAVEQE